MKKFEFSFTVGENIKWCRHFGNILVDPQNVKESYHNNAAFPY